MKTNKGISLIVLVITIVVMIILAGVIILTLSSNGIIGKANEAVEKTNIRQIESLATMLWAEAYEKSDGSQGALYDAVMEGLSNNEITPDKYEGYRIDVTESGVKVVKIGTSSDDQPAGDPLNHAGIIPTGGRYISQKASSEGARSDEYTAGQAFPEGVYDGDRYYYGDYEYHYTSEYYHYWGGVWSTGWKVSLNTSVDKNTYTTPGEILETINGKAVNNMESTFANCSALTTFPTIPSTVTDIDYIFQNCTSLGSVFQYNGTVEDWEKYRFSKSGWSFGSSITTVDCTNKQGVCAVHNGLPTSSSEYTQITCPTCGTEYWDMD